MVRNSVNSPLRIDSVQLKSGGEIGMTLCPGKHEESAFSGTWARDLDADIRAIANWGAVSVVTLMEKGELVNLKASNIGDAVENAGMDWHFLPISDVSVPNEHFENL